MQLLNFFLTALSAADVDALSGSLVETSFSAAQVLYEPHDPVDVIYFPGSACISIVTVLEDGKAVETSTVGRESAVALVDAISGESARSRIFAQIGGSAMRMSASAYRNRLQESPKLMRLTLLHIRATALQAEQGVACNASHGVHQRLARWLLMTQDRVGSDAFPLTQEYMAVMTGVQRSTVSLMAATLKREGVIDYSRGLMRIVDRPALEAHACECYSVIGQQFDDLRQVAV